MQIGKARHVKTCEDFGKIMNEHSRGLRYHYQKRNIVPKSQDILHGSKHPKGRRNEHLRTGKHTGAPRALPWPPSMGEVTRACWKMCPEHAENALGRLACAPSMGKSCQNYFLLQVETLPVNSTPLIHNFSFRTKWFKRKANTRSFHRGVYLLTPSLLSMFYFFYNFSLVIMSN